MVYAVQRTRGWPKPIFFLLAILITKGIKLALASLYLDSLYVQLDKCARNMIAQLAILEGRGGE